MNLDYSTAMNFSWIEQDRIAGCRGPRSDSDLVFLASSGIGALVRLAHENETGVSRADVEAHGLEDCYEPVPDWNPPTQTQIDGIIAFIRSVLAKGKSVAVSCGAGYGRTGTILGCYLVASGQSAEDAIQHLLSVRPCSGEILTVPGQKAAVVEFGRRTLSSNAGQSVKGSFELPLPTPSAVAKAMADRPACGSPRQARDKLTWAVTEPTRTVVVVG